MELWYEHFGFRENPFTIKPSGEMLGHDSEFTTIAAKVSVGEVVFITGQYGFGKSTMLKSLISRFRGERRVIYYSCNTSDETIEFDNLLVNANNFLGKFLRLRKKGAILLLDEAQDVNIRSLLLLPHYFNKGFFHSIVFVTSKPEKFNIPRELKELIDENKFNIGDISEEDAVKLIRRRFTNEQFLPDNVIIQLFSRDKNPRSLLKNCEDLCRDVVERGKDKAALADVKRLFE